jgi:riboflavin kinase/FMN adenylyltransferase
MGYPTANIVIEERYKLIPSDGIFAVEVKSEDKTYKGMAYIGTRPTVNGLTRNIEVNIFDFDKDIYGKKLRVYVKQYLRGEQKFAGLDALKEQLAKDKENAIENLIPKNK